MKEITSDLRTEILLSDDGTKRYSLRKVWDSSKPSLAIIMLAPSQAGEIALDTSSMLTINNCHRLGKGSVTIVNLFSKINDFALKEADTEDPENIRAIVAAAESADCVVLAAGTGKAKNKTDASYFMTNPEDLKYEYIKHLHAITINKDVEKLSIKSPEFIQLENQKNRLESEISSIRAEMGDVKDMKKKFEDFLASVGK